MTLYAYKTPEGEILQETVHVDSSIAAYLAVKAVNKPLLQLYFVGVADYPQLIDCLMAEGYALVEVKAVEK